jgi:hypothetical protein
MVPPGVRTTPDPGTSRRRVGRRGWGPAQAVLNETFLGDSPTSLTIARSSLISSNGRRTIRGCSCLFLLFRSHLGRLGRATAFVVVTDGR